MSANIRVDETPAVCTVSCTACPSFVRLADDRDRAERAGRDHINSVHTELAGRTSFERSAQMRHAASGS